MSWDCEVSGESFRFDVAGKKKNKIDFGIEVDDTNPKIYPNDYVKRKDHKWVEVKCLEFKKELKFKKGKLWFQNVKLICSQCQM